MKQPWKDSETLNRLAGPGLFNLRLFWWSYAVAIPIQIATDVIGFSSPDLLWIVVWSFGHALATLIGILFRYSFLDRLQRKYPTVSLNLIVAAVLGVVRVTTIGYLSFIWQLQDQFLLWNRVVAGAIFGVMLFGFLTNVLEANSGYVEDVKRLVATEGKLEKLRRQTKESIRSSQLELRDKVTKVITPALDRIENLMEQTQINPKTRTTIRNDLSSLLEDQVRPLSSSLRASSKAIEDKNRFNRVSRLLFVRVPARVKPELAIRPGLSVLVHFATVPFSFWIYGGDQWIGFGQLTALVNVFLILFASQVLKGIGLTSRGPAIGLLAITSALPVLFDYLIMISLNFPNSGILPSLMMVAIASVGSILGFGIVAVHDYNRLFFVEQLKENNQKIERELALLSQKVWVEKRQWALAIHGTVQASLTAALARLSQNKTPKSGDIKAIKAHLDQARNGLKGQNVKLFQFSKAIREIRDTWSGIVDVKIDLTSPAARKLAKDVWASICVNEIVKEAVSNSMRHGKASLVKIDFETKQKGFIDVVIQDNGKGVSGKASGGLGSQLLDEIAHPWTLETNAVGGATLRARIVVAS